MSIKLWQFVRWSGSEIISNLGNLNFDDEEEEEEK